MGNERRRYVRVSDIVSLRYRILDEEEKVAQENAAAGPHFGSQLLQLDNQLQLLLPRLKEWNSNVGEAIDLLNQKIMVLSEQMTEEPTGEVLVAREVSLSACGIAFPGQERAGVDDSIWLELVLRPIHVKVVATGRVVGCERLGDDPKFPYYIRVDLTGVSEEDQESLIQHVIRRESQILRQQRQSREAAENESSGED